uniref:Uncharacterized protein n=1 Tax=Rhizophora mucronata TaxID=61149 RepID=A0A2P2PYU8_RHIMU
MAISFHSHSLQELRHTVIVPC